ncbi:hypothetical protein [Phenylobacterium sp.]|uniref:hypothetical protein n=1 Tax=Phenylobacterium sp. TaxID=1871053 RepID=UPI0027372892|nr:hypothetical protein [Phenylobacterium sp.]MDP3855833.1 hypothetical protein [Phenylobacterium sp.]
MIRIAVLTAAAAIAFAAPAAAAEVRVSLVGKTAAQIDADLNRAARTVCMRETFGETLITDAYGRCVRATLKVAQARLAEVQAAD